MSYFILVYFFFLHLYFCFFSYSLFLSLMNFLFVYFYAGFFLILMSFDFVGFFLIYIYSTGIVILFIFVVMMLYKQLIIDTTTFYFDLFVVFFFFFVLAFYFFFNNFFFTFNIGNDYDLFYFFEESYHSFKHVSFVLYFFYSPCLIFMGFYLIFVLVFVVDLLLRKEHYILKYLMTLKKQIIFT